MKDRHDWVLYCLLVEAAGSLGLKVPRRGPSGGARMGVEGTRRTRLLVDLVIPTDRQTDARRLDLVVCLKEQRRVVIFEVAVAWEPVVEERFCEKAEKYRTLAADLAKQWEGYKVKLVPVVVGTMGLVLKRLRRELGKAKIFPEKNLNRLILSLQREAMCGTVRLLRTHLAEEEPENMNTD